MVSKICMGGMGLCVGEMGSEMHANRASSRERVVTMVRFVRNFWMDRWKIHRLREQNTRAKISLLDMGVGRRQLVRPLSP